MCGWCVALCTSVCQSGFLGALSYIKCVHVYWKTCDCVCGVREDDRHETNGEVLRRNRNRPGSEGISHVSESSHTDKGGLDG